jgi:hypothetical protein
MLWGGDTVLCRKREVGTMPGTQIVSLIEDEKRELVSLLYPREIPVILESM